MLPSSSFYPIRDLLTNSETPLGKLIAQARAIEDLNTTFRTVLDPSLIPHCRVGIYENGILTLFADSGAYATRLRFHIPTILSTLRNFSQWCSLRSIQVKVRAYLPTSHLPATSHADTPTLSDSTLSQITELVSVLKNKPGNEALVSSLERLAKSAE